MSKINELAQASCKLGVLIDINKKAYMKQAQKQTFTKNYVHCEFRATTNSKIKISA